jgi:hypothetical protein
LNFIRQSRDQIEKSALTTRRFVPRETNAPLISVIPAVLTRPVFRFAAGEAGIQQ